MGQDSKIEWTHHTFNPWHGCHKVSPGCKHCYAESFSRRVGRAIWGPTAKRWLPSNAYWKQLAKWNREAEAAGERRRVFVASMADVGEIHVVPEINEILNRERARLWAEIDACPWLDLLLVTKRPENFASIVPASWMRDGFPLNVWVLVSVESQEYADERVPKLLDLPVRAVRGVSYEPALGEVDFFRWLEPFVDVDPMLRPTPRLNWIIVGGESGPGARAFDLAWARSTVEQCRSAGAACFVKQIGAITLDSAFAERDGTPAFIGGIKDKKGGDWSEWPKELRVREFPRAA